MANVKKKAAKKSTGKDHWKSIANKFDFALPALNTKSFGFDVSIYIAHKKKTGTGNSHGMLRLTGYFKINKLKFKTMSIGVSDDNKYGPVVLVFDNDYFKKDSVELRDYNGTQGFSSLALSQKILDAFEIKQKPGVNQSHLFTVEKLNIKGMYRLIHKK